MSENIFDERWELPARFSLSNELLRINDEQQEALATQLSTPFASAKDQVEAERARAAHILPEQTEHLTEIRRQIKAEKDKKQKVLLKAAEQRIAAQLAETLAALGKFEAASVAEPDTEKSENYKLIAKAVAAPDFLWCDCGEQGGELPVTNRFVEREIHHEGKKLFVLKCRQCGLRNAVADLPTDQILLRAARTEARSFASEMSPEDAKQLLKRQKHTTREILNKQQNQI